MPVGWLAHQEEALLNRCRALLANLAFKIPYTSYVEEQEARGDGRGRVACEPFVCGAPSFASRTTSFDHGKPLVVPAGSDSLSNIGTPFPLAWL
jgi:hypothetical protein